MCKKIILQLLTISISLYCCACGKKTDLGSENIVQNTNPQEETSIESSEEKNLAPEENILTTEENEMENWLVEVAQQGISLVAWNEINNKKHIFEENETYQAVDGDRFFICTPSSLHSVSMYPSDTVNLQKPNDNYCEISLMDNIAYAFEDLEVECENGEQGTLKFLILTENYVFLDGYEYYFKDENDVIYFGFNIPEGYSSNWSDNNLNDLTCGSLRLTVEETPNMEEIYNGLTQQREYTDTMTVESIDREYLCSLTYEEIGECSTPYGKAKLYEEYATMDFVDLDDTNYAVELAILYVNGHYISISFSDSLKITGDITDIIQQLF